MSGNYRAISCEQAKLIVSQKILYCFMSFSINNKLLLIVILLLYRSTEWLFLNFSRKINNLATT